MSNEILNRVSIDGTDFYRDQHGQLWKKVAGIYKKTNEEPKPTVIHTQQLKKITVDEYKTSNKNFEKPTIIIILLGAIYFWFNGFIIKDEKAEIKQEIIQKEIFTKTVYFLEDDFYWDDVTTPYKDIIIAGVNKVHHENKNCKSIDPESAYKSSSKGSFSNPVFYVVCGVAPNVFNAYFSKSDVDNERNLKAVNHVDKSFAIQACEKYAKVSSTYPSTVSFSKIMDLSIIEHANSRTTVKSTFTAKNAFNLEVRFNISCLLDSSGFFEGNINKAIN